MQADLVKKIQQHPKYVELVSKRRAFAWTLAIIMLVIYYTFDNQHWDSHWYTNYYISFYLDWHLCAKSQQ
jgi:hypothetical protein